MGTAEVGADHNEEGVGVEVPYCHGTGRSGSIEYRLLL